MCEVQTYLYLSKCIGYKRLLENNMYARASHANFKSINRFDKFKKKTFCFFIFAQDEPFSQEQFSCFFSTYGRMTYDLYVM